MLCHSCNGHLEFRSELVPKSRWREEKTCASVAVQTAAAAISDDLFDMHTAKSVKQTLKGSKKPMPNGEQITRHVAKIPRREFTTSLLHPLPIIVKQPRTADTARAVNLFRKSPLHRVCLDGPASMNYETRYVLHASSLALAELASSKLGNAARHRRCCCFHTKKQGS